MPYEIFHRKYRKNLEPSVAFMKSGRFAFNKAAGLFFLKNNIEYVNLVWDKEKRLIGFQSVPSKNEMSFRIRHIKGSDAVGFSCISFMRYIGYNRKETCSFPIQWNEPEKMFIVKFLS